MIPSLRMRVIEAGAEVLVCEDRPLGRFDAEAVLDAMLDCLTENQDETVHLMYGSPEPWRLGDIAVEDLPVVLRED